MNRGICLALLLPTLLCAGEARAYSAEDSAFVRWVFPYQPGDRYEFRSNLDFLRPTGEILPAYTEAPVVVADTTFNGTHYLHMPYLSFVGSEFYRLDDSLRVWTYYPAPDTEVVLLNLNRIRDPFVERDFFYLSSHWPRGPNLGRQFHFAYSTVPAYADVDSTYLASNVVFSSNWSWLARGTTMGYATQLYADTLLDRDSERGFFLAMMGDSIPGQVRYAASLGIELAALFRHETEEPWPAAIDRPVSVPRAYARATSLIAAPNPFNPSTTVRFDLPESGAVRLVVYDVTGRLVRTLLHGHVAAGAHSVVWDGLDTGGRSAASGVYVVRLTTDTHTLHQRVTLLR